MGLSIPLMQGGMCTQITLASEASPSVWLTSYPPHHNQYKSAVHGEQRWGRSHWDD